MLYAYDPFGAELQRSANALDSMTIDLCLALFPWARFRERKGTVKKHTLIDLHGNNSLFVCVMDGKVHDVNMLAQIVPEARAFDVPVNNVLAFQVLEQGWPVGGAMVVMAPEWFLKRWSGYSSQMWTMPADGALERRMIPPGVYRVIAAPPGSLWGWALRPIKATAGY